MIETTHRLTLQVGQLEAIVVDNHDGLGGADQNKRKDAMAEAAGHLGQLYCTVPFEDRFNGYNGVALLRYAKSPSPFLPCCSGLNCEYAFDEVEGTYEPRWSRDELLEAQPSELERLSSSSARLLIEPGRRWETRIETNFKLVEPCFLDVEHSVTLTSSATPRRLLRCPLGQLHSSPKGACFLFHWKDLAQGVSEMDGRKSGLGLA